MLQVVSRCAALDKKNADAKAMKDAAEADANSTAYLEGRKANEEQVKKDEAARVAAKPGKDSEKAAAVKAARDALKEEGHDKKLDEEKAAKAQAEVDGKAARKAQAEAANRSWAVDLVELAKKVDADVPRERRANVMEGLEGVQANIEAARENLTGSDGKKKKKKKAKAGQPVTIDPDFVPDSWNKKMVVPNAAKYGKGKNKI